MYQEKPDPNPDEVSNAIWVDFKELFSKVSTLEYISGEESLLLQDSELKEKTQPVTITVGNQELLLAPWTIFMLKNSKLFDAYTEITSQN
jgi:hypothetical protein